MQASTLCRTRLRPNKQLPAVSKHITDQGRRPIDTCGRVGGQGQADARLALAAKKKDQPRKVSGLKRPPTSSARTTSSLARRAWRKAAISARLWSRRGAPVEDKADTSVVSTTSCMPPHRASHWR